MKISKKKGQLNNKIFQINKDLKDEWIIRKKEVNFHRKKVNASCKLA